MTVCVVCGEENFDARDGLYFCTTCHTQSQDIRQEEEEEYVGTITHTLAIKQPKEAKKEKPVIDKGRPWHTYEGFLIIIREQVQALIKLGAPKILEDKVFRLWGTYLSKTGTAFPENPKKVPAVLKNARRHREKYPGTLENAAVDPVMIRRKYKNKFGLSDEKFEAEMANKEVADKLLSEDFYEGDNPVDEDGHVSDDDVQSVMSDLTSGCSDDGDKERRNIKKKNVTEKVKKDPHYHKHIEWMNMLKTLCFCYIGLLYSGCLVTSSDITRWVKKGKIPYYNAMHLFPPDMKFCNYDHCTFMYVSVPHSHTIRETAGKLAQFLGLTELPNYSLPELIHRYIIMLELPAELHGYVLNLLRVKPAVMINNIECTGRIPHYEAMAMIYIITVLQLLLGLDDYTERKLSEYAKEINRLLNDDDRLFIWEDWCIHISRKFYMAKAQQIYAKQFDPSDVTNVDVFMDHFQILFNKRNPKNSMKSASDSYVKTREVTKESIQRPIQLLMDKWNLSSKYSKSLQDEDLQAENESEADYNPDELSTLIEEDPFGFLLSEKSVETGEHTFQPKKHNELTHRAKTLKYVTQTESFLEELDKCGLTDFTIYSSCVEKSESSSNNSSDSDLDEHPLKCSKSTKTKKSKKKNYSKTAVKHLLSNRQKGESIESSFIDKKKYSEIIQNLTDMREDFKLNRDKNDRSRSLRWLIEICSLVIECESEVLEKELFNFQLDL